MAVTGLLDPVQQDEKGRAGSRRKIRIAAEGVRGDGEETRVRLHNISTGGLLLESDSAIAVGEEIVLDLPEAGPTAAQIVWQSASLHGCRFVEPLGPGALSAAQLRSAIAPAEAEADVPHAPRGSLGKRLSRLRQERGMTLAQVAESLGVSKPTVWAWEHDRSHPVAGRIAALAETLGVAETELATGQDLSRADHAIAAAREAIAEAYGCAPNRVRIMLDL
ncbi:MAG: helix-turn-helix domain-containing protein [Erythrobacter sp.]|jgi:transcriptional regulator with XRE-family HTH domain|nr:helix-turn-helix domain-containing protein [Erythrobacter sp.]